MTYDCIPSDADGDGGAAYLFDNNDDVLFEFDEWCYDCGALKIYTENKWKLPLNNLK